MDLPKKHGRGGQSALRFARLRMEKRHNYVRKIAELAVQVRYRSAPEPARLIPLPATDADSAALRPHRVRLEFAEEQFSITPGQAAVFYAGEVLLGGGLIQADPAPATGSHQ